MTSIPSGALKQVDADLLSVGHAEADPAGGPAVLLRAQRGRLRPPSHLAIVIHRYRWRIAFTSSSLTGYQWHRPITARVQRSTGRPGG